MHLYALTLQKASCIYQAVHGNFAGTKQQEILVGRGKTLELLRPDPNTGKLYSILSKEMFGLIRSLTPFRLTGSTKGKRARAFYLVHPFFSRSTDYIVVGGDSGRITILEYNAAKNIFEKVCY